MLTAVQVTSFDGLTCTVIAVGFQKEGRWMYTGSEDGTIKIWDMRSPHWQRDYAHKVAVTTVVLHPNQGEIISADQSGCIKIWDLTMNMCTHELVPEEGVAIRSLSVAADGTLLVAASNTGNVYVWRMDNGKDTQDLRPITMIRAHDTYILKCLLSPNVKLLATASADHTVKIWNTTNFTLEKTLTGHQRWVWDCSFSADSAYLVTGADPDCSLMLMLTHDAASSDHSARLWDLSTGETMRQYTGHSKSIVCIALNDLGG